MEKRKSFGNIVVERDCEGNKGGRVVCIEASLEGNIIFKGVGGDKYSEQNMPC
jgi:hypothetical protein